MKKTVSFKDLCLIQEQEEDGAGEITADIQDLLPGTLNTAGYPAKGREDLDNLDGQGQPIKPAACPFGDRIAKERVAKGSAEQTQEVSKEHLEEKFPKNIILIQAAEKEKAAKRKRTAGINPEAGKEKGTSFISTRNYLAAITENSLSLQPGGLYKKTINISECSQPSHYTCQSSSKGMLFPEGDNQIVWSNKHQQWVSGEYQGLSQTNSFTGNQGLSQQGSVQPHSERSNTYHLDPSLCKSVNPFLAPSNQFYGSVAYGLKDIPQEHLSKPDIVASSRVNNYLHHPRDYISPAACSHFQDQQTSVNRDYQTLEQNTHSNPPQLQFLRQNFPTPPPISKETLFHTDSNFVQSSGKSASDFKTQQYQDNRQRLNQSRSPTPVPPKTVVGPVVSTAQESKQPVTNLSNAISSSNNKTSTMNFIGGTTGFQTNVAPLSRVQEKEELQRLNDRFSAYVGRVRQLGQQVNNVDTSAFLMSTKILEDEIINLKNMYETELEKLRKEIELGSHERNNLHVQHNKQQQYVGELQDRLSIETDKNQKLVEEINVLQRKIGNLEAEVKDARIAAQVPKDSMDQLHRNVENLTREVEQWKHRYEHEQVARQESEDRVQQIMKKLEFSEQVQNQQVQDYQTRLDTSSATILSLESRVRELSTADVTVSEMLQQVRATAETELRKFQIESEEQYSRNLSALKAQIDNDADALQRYSQEKSVMMGNIGELQAKIRNLEGQVANLLHQKQTLEDAVSVERNRAADNIQQLEKKLREVQDMLIVKMREVTNAREASLPLKAEIEALKALLEEEERRLRVPLGIVPASVVQSTVPQPPTTSQILNTSSLNALQAATSSCQPSTTAKVQSSIIGTGTRGCAVQDVPSAPSQPLPPVKPPVSMQMSAQSSQQFTPAPNVVSTAPNTTAVSANYDYSSTFQSAAGLTNPLYPYEPSPPLDTLYLPEALQSVDDEAVYDANCGPGLAGYDLYMQGFTLPMTGPRYHYEATPSMNCLQVDPSPPLTPRAVGPVASRAKSAPVHADRNATTVETSKATKTTTSSKEKNVHLIPANLGHGRDYFDDMFHDLERDTLFPKPRPKSSPLEREMPSSFHDYTVSTSSAIGDLKILEVNQDGKFVRLVNDGPTEFEFGGYMIQQNVGGHPVAVFRFPPRTKFPPDSTVTVWSAMNDPHLHNPPTDFYWKEQQKWGTGPECTTILCRANGQAVAWTTAAHRFTKDAFLEQGKSKEGEVNNRTDVRDDECLTELNMDANGPKPEPVYLRREKQQPPSLTAQKHPHGTSPSVNVHPNTGQQRPLRYGNDNSTYSRQSRTQAVRPDPIPGQPYSGAPAQRVGSAPLKKLGGSQGSQTPTIRGNGTLANKSAGSIRMAPPSPYLSPLQEQLIDETRDRANFLIRFTS